MLSLLKFMSMYMWSWTEIGQIRLFYFRVRYSFLWGSWQQFTSSKCRSRKNHYQFIFFYLVVTWKSQSFFSLVKGLEKGNFQNNAFWGGLAIRLFYISVDMARGSLPFPQLLVRSHYLMLTLRWARSAHMSAQKLLRVEEMSKGRVFSIASLKVWSLFQLKCKRANTVGSPDRAGAQNQDGCPWFI